MVRYRNGTRNGDGLVPLDVLVKAMEEAGTPQEVIETVVLAIEPKLITIEAAAEKFQMGVHTIHTYLKRGHLEEKGRQKFAAPGGGKILIDENELVALLEHPPKPGRPRKSNGQTIMA